MNTEFVYGMIVGAAITVVIAFIGGAISRHRDPRHNKWGFDKR